MAGSGSAGSTGKPRGEGRYIYCVVEGEHQDSLGKVGIEENEVFTIAGGGFSALAHVCPGLPYDSEDQETVKKWVVTHDEVVQMASKKYGVVIPMGFDTIVKGEDGEDAAKNVRDWLDEENEALKSKLERVEGKAEYGVQLFWSPEYEGKQIILESEELMDLSRKIESGPKGSAYMYRQRLERELKKKLEEKATEYFNKFYDSIRGCVDDIRVERTKKSEELQMLANFSCLATPGQSERLGEELEKIESAEGFSARFTGPWPPYSFVAGG
ncbi:MAG: GvpL/GvpF family gas vesicle protein [Chloroflexota bacterium]|nr:GvpL/GvpF family gas vesicle protein [Chloroflexota bacterium]